MATQDKENCTKVTTGCTQYIASTLVFTAIVHNAVEERVVKHLKTDPQQAARHQVLTIVLTTISPSPHTHFRQGQETLSCLTLSVFPTSFPPGLCPHFPASFLLVSVSLALFSLCVPPPQLRQGRETLSCLPLFVFPTSFPPGLFLPFPTSFPPGLFLPFPASFLLVSVSLGLFSLCVPLLPPTSDRGRRH